ncbi:hypothetical protein [Lentzea nigeriaca]|uniref:hypothetical protein n=1 Tax=Lentzea nigeriaca TaxID=1128665 RepID=UPI00195AA77A|nr:hypothetical protein [Lentzea nigeriaca]MBM7863829.1 hypothetical protein [Lentzea nigeriaca]
MSTTLTTVRNSWFTWVTAGEFTGFLAPALAGALTSSAPLLVLAGIVEGVVLGAAQCVVLRRTFHDFDASRWIGVTALAAGFAWAIAMLAAGNAERLGTLPLPAVILLAAMSGAAVLLSLGTGQWLVLRHYVRHASNWIWANALAWGAGLIAFTAVTTPLWQPGQTTVLITLIGALGGLVMAATMAAITGFALTRLVER